MTVLIQTTDTGGAGSISTAGSKATTEVIQAAANSHYSALSTFAPLAENANDLSVRTRPVIDKWTKIEDRRFDVLSEKYALGKIVEAELNEFRNLSQQRNSLFSPLPTADVLRELKRRELLRDTLELLDRYVEFDRPTNSARS